jgi:hypothetical protein
LFVYIPVLFTTFIMVLPKRLSHIPSMSTVMCDDVAYIKSYATMSHIWDNQQMYSVDELDILGIGWKVPLSDPNKVCRLVDTMNHHGMEYCWWDILSMNQDKT